MQCTAFALGPLETNCYLIYEGREAVAVDPGGDPAEVLDFLREHSLTLTHILLTHLHFDHTYGVAELARATKAPVFAAEEDRYMLESSLAKGGMWGLPQVDFFEYSSLGAGELPLLGGVCRVLTTPGHTPGGLSFYFSGMDAVFAGDTLFYRSIGRTDFPGGSLPTLTESVRSQLFTLPETTEVFPGHGPSTRVGDEKRNNPFVSDFAL